MFRALPMTLFLTSLGYAEMAWGELVWQEKVISGGVETAQLYCNKPWRLPHASELVQLARESPKLRPRGLYWSSTPIASVHGERWIVDSVTGDAYISDPSELHWVRCVRDS